MQLEIRDLYKSFGEKQVLKGIFFTAKDYHAFGLLGRNGAGKTNDHTYNNGRIFMRRRRSFARRQAD